MRRLALGLLLGLLMLGPVLLGQAHAQAGPSSAPGRVALVIGNASYAASPLRNPLNDALDMAVALRELGFAVVQIGDADARTMRAAIRQFAERLRGSEVGLFYYAGHGVQGRNGRNYLIPVGAEIHHEFELEDEALDANRVLAAMEEAGTRVNIVIMDACRDNPFARSWRGAGGGLAQMNAPAGSFIGFATSPGSVAADGTGRNGLYTRYLLENLRQGDSDIDRVFTRVTAAVAEATGRQQVPWRSSSLTADFHFRAGDKAVATIVETPRPVSPSPVSPSPVSPISPAQPPGEADLRRGLQYRYGRGGVARNEAEALRLFRLAAAQGNVAAIGQIGVFHLNALGGLSRDDAEARRLLQQAADAADAVAQNALGTMHEEGRGGFVRSDRDALSLYQLSAAAGNSLGQTNLGRMHEAGRAGLAVNTAEAVRYYRLAAEQGVQYAQAAMADIYAEGRGVPRNVAEARRWYRLAAEQGGAIGAMASFKANSLR